MDRKAVGHILPGQRLTIYEDISLFFSAGQSETMYLEMEK